MDKCGRTGFDKDKNSPSAGLTDHGADHLRTDEMPGGLATPVLRVSGCWRSLSLVYPHKPRDGRPPGSIMASPVFFRGRTPRIALSHRTRSTQTKKNPRTRADRLRVLGAPISDVWRPGLQRSHISRFC